MRRTGFCVWAHSRSLYWIGLGVLVWSALACDTVAEISFEQREFSDVVTVGMVKSGSCTDTDVVMTFKFALFDGDGVLIEPGDQIGDTRVDIEGDDANFTEEDIEFVSSYLYPSPDQPCSGDGDCDGPFTCVPVNPFSTTGDAARACGMSTVVGVLQRPLVFDDGQYSEMSIVIDVDYSESLLGVDEDGNFDPSRSTDRFDERIAAANAFVLNYSRTAFAGDTEMCVARFGGTNESGVFFLDTEENCLTRLTRDYGGGNDGTDLVIGRVSSLAIGETGDSPVWVSDVLSVDRQLASTGGDRAIVMFSDGPDDSSLTWDFDDVVATAQTNEVAIHSILLDNLPPEGDVERPYIPVADQDLYAQLACETGGSFQYATAPDDLRTMFLNVAGNVAAAYEVEAEVAELATLDPGAYRLATGVQVTLLGTQVTFQLAGDKIDPATQKIIDDRLILFVRPVPETEEEPVE